MTRRVAQQIADGGAIVPGHAQQPGDRREDEPKIVCMDGGKPAKPGAWTQPKMPFTIAISARNAISMAAMFNARCSPSPAPCAAASITLTAVFSILTSTLPGGDRLIRLPASMIFASMMVAGAVMITAVSRCRISTCAIITYAAITAPETCAMPLTMMVNNSDSVMPAINGRMVSGASVWPMKMLAATLSDSAPLAPMIFCIPIAIAFTTHCMMPR